MGVEDRLDRGEVVLARVHFVIDEGRGQARLAGMDRQKLDSLLALAVGVALEAVTLFHELGDARADALVLDGGAVEGEERHRRERLHGGGGGVLAHKVAVAEIIATGGEALAQAVLERARQGQLDRTLGHDGEAAAGRALLGDDVARLVLGDGELGGEGRQFVVAETAEQRDAAQGGRADGAGAAVSGEFDAAGLGQHHRAAVDPVDAAGDVDKGQQAMEPAWGIGRVLDRSDGRRREIACRRGAHAQTGSTHLGLSPYSGRRQRSAATRQDRIGTAPVARPLSPLNDLGLILPIIRCIRQIVAAGMGCV